MENTFVIYIVTLDGRRISGQSATNELNCINSVYINAVQPGKASDACFVCGQSIFEKDVEVL